MLLGWDRAQKRILCWFTWPLRWKVASSLKKWCTVQEIRMVFGSLTEGLLRGTSLSLLHRSEVVKSVSYTETGENPGALCAFNWSLWKICFLGQTSCGFSWWLLQTLSHSHDVIFCLDWPAAGHCELYCYSAHFHLSRRRFIVSIFGWSVSIWKAGLWSRSPKSGFQFPGLSLWGRQVVQIMECFLFSMNQIVLEPEPKKIRSLEPEPEIWVRAPQPCWKIPPKFSLSLDNWFRREMGLYNLDQLKMGKKTLELNYDLCGRQKPGIIWQKIIAIIKWTDSFWTTLRLIQ